MLRRVRPSTELANDRLKRSNALLSAAATRPHQLVRSQLKPGR
jgi:hypothetical protein